MWCKYCEQPIYADEGTWRNWDDDSYCPESKENRNHEPMIGNENDLKV